MPLIFRYAVVSDFEFVPGVMAGQQGVGNLLRQRAVTCREYVATGRAAASRRRTWRREEVRER